jgi:hypothetical protein
MVFKEFQNAEEGIRFMAEGALKYIAQLRLNGADVNILGNRMFFHFARRGAHVLFIFTLDDTGYVLTLQEAKVRIWKNDTRLVYNFEHGVEEVFYSCSRGEISAKAKRTDSLPKLDIGVLPEMMSSMKALYRYVRLLSSFDTILPRSILCRTF